MSDLKDPPRLLEASGGAEPGLRELLSAAKNDVGSDAQVARLAERLAPLLAPPAVPVPPVAANAARMGAAAKLGLAGIANLFVPSLPPSLADKITSKYSGNWQD